MTNVVWLKGALENLGQQIEYIARHDPQAAARAARRVRLAIERLAEFPAMGRPGRVPHTRELLVPGTPFVVPYRVTNGRLEILRVFHGRQAWPEDI